MFVSLRVKPVHILNQAEYLDGILAEQPLEEREDFAEKGVSLLLDDPEVTAHYEMVVNHGRIAMTTLSEEDGIDE